MITVTKEPAGTRISVDGWLAGDGVTELLGVIDAVDGPARLLAHDLRGADAAGLSLLRGLADAGMVLEGLSTYMQLMLANPGSVGPLESHSHRRPTTPVKSNKEKRWENQ